MILCVQCKLQCILDYKKNLDEAYLDFLVQYDHGTIQNKEQFGQLLITTGILQSEDEIKKMMKNHNPDDLTKSILFSKNDYVSYYKTIKEPEPETGSRSEERRVGKECRLECRSRWSPYH